MGVMQEFREFAVKGNVIDLAVGVIIGGAFGKIVDSVVADLIMPVAGMVFGKLDFSSLFVVLGQVPAGTGTSLDAMAVGVSLGMMKITIWEPSAVIGLVTALLSLVGLRIGRYLGAKFGKCMEVIGGVVLLIIAIKILLTG